MYKVLDLISGMEGRKGGREERRREYRKKDSRSK
jgi:hypothetical protein